MALLAGASALLAVLTITGALPPRHLMSVVGISFASVAAVGLLWRAAKIGPRRDAAPALLWSLAMLSIVGAMGWDMRILIPGAVISVAAAVLGRRYKVAL
jgi:hypothetical protein